MREGKGGGNWPEISTSPISGNISALPACSPWHQSERATPHSLRPEQKFSVPSIGSSTATHSASGTCGGVSLSSATSTRPGRRWCNKSPSRLSWKWSALVTGLPSGFHRTSCRKASVCGKLAQTKPHASSRISVTGAVIGHPPLSAPPELTGAEPAAIEIRPRCWRSRREMGRLPAMSGK